MPISVAELRTRRDVLSASVVAQEFSARPELGRRYGEMGRIRCEEDVGRHLDYLIAAVEQDSPRLFQNYLEWAAVLLGRLGIPGEELTANMAVLRDALARELSNEHFVAVSTILDAAVETLPDSAARTPESFIEALPVPFRELAAGYLDALLRQDRTTAADLIMDAVEAGRTVRDVYLNVFQPTQYEVGRLWQLGEVSVAEEHYCTAATQLVMARLYPYVFATVANGRNLIAACVGGDLHEIGLRMVADFFQLEGWDTLFLGANTPAGPLVEMVAARRPDIVAISSTMSFHVGLVAETVAEIRSRAPDVRVLVGGYPFRVDEQLWRRVGADGMARDAAAALLEAGRLLGGDGHGS